MTTHVNDGMTEDEVIAALEEASRKAEEEADKYYTRLELEDMTGWSERKVWRVLRKLKDADRLDVRRKQRENLAGYPYSAPAYRIMPPRD